MNIKLDSNNCRVHDDRNKRLIRKSLEDCGAGRSVLLDNENCLIAGNGVYEQAKELGLPVKIIESDGTELIAIKRTDLSTENVKRKTLALADNHTSDTSFFDMEIVVQNFTQEELADWDIEVPKLESDNDKNEKEDDIPSYVNYSLIKRGDMVEMNNHRMLCGDSCSVDDIKQLMNGEKADMIFTDPPYDLNADTAWMNSLNDSINNGHIIVMLSDKQLDNAIKNIDGDFKRMYIADTRIASPTNNDVYVNHILTLRFAKGKYPKFNNIYNGGRSIIQMKYRKNNPESVMHPHSKPVSFVELFILYWSSPNNTVLDLFGGSGSTLITCEKNNRTCYLNEFAPRNCDTILKRWILYMREFNQLFEVKINGEKLNDDFINEKIVN